MQGYLITYTDPKRNEGHEDPVFREFTYGAKGKWAPVLSTKVKPGDFLFFHTQKRRKRIITAYYHVETIMKVKDARKDTLIMLKYQNPHLFDYGTDEDVIVFANPITSQILRYPIEVDELLLSGLSRKAKLNPAQTGRAALGSALRSWKPLTEDDIKFLLSKMSEENATKNLTTSLLSNEEIEQLEEREIEDFIAAKPETIGLELKLLKRQLVLDSKSRLDLLLKDTSNGDLVVVEIKKGLIGKDAYDQIRGYIKKVRQMYQGNNVRGVIVCNGILPIYEEFYETLEDDIEPYLYGWTFDMKKYFKEAGLV